MTTFAVKTGSKGSWSDPNSWSPHAVPGPNDFDILINADVTASGITISGQNIIEDATSGNASTSLTLSNATLDTNTTIITAGSGNDAFLNCNNANLNGIVAASYGPTIMEITKGNSATVNGYIGASNPTNPADLLISAAGTFALNGFMDSGQNGAITVLFGAQSENGQQVVWNQGTAQADNGGALAYTAQFGGAVGNLGKLNAIGGRMSIYGANLVNVGSNASVNVASSGTFDLEGSCSGATINISSGTLEFGTSTALQFLSTPVNLTGSSATFQFDGATVKSETFDPSTNKLSIAADFPNAAGVAGTIQLQGQNFAAGQFSVAHTQAGDQINWLHG